MRTISVTAYKFDELSDAAKERARDWWREGAFQDQWWDNVYADAVQIAEILGIELYQRPYQTVGGSMRHEPGIYFSGFASQGDGARFEGIYRYAKGMRKKIRDYAPQDEKLHRIADGLYELQRHALFTIECRIGHSGRYEHKYTMTFDYGYEGDIRGRFGPEEQRQFQDLMRDFAQWIYDALETEYEYQNSDEVVDENIRANEYDFTEEGKRCVTL
jgi:hypothetical protein